MAMREINLTEGNDAKLNALMKRRGELFPVELSEEVKAEVVSRVGTRTACSCVVTDKGRVLVDISGELPSGGYILAVYGVLDGHKWRSACRGLHITKVTMPGIGNGMIAEGDPYDIEMEVEMYIQPSSNEAIRIHNEDGEAHADIRRMIPKIPANIVTDENYHHTDENYTSVEKEKLAHLVNYDDTQIRQMIAETSGNFVNYYQKKDIYSKLQMDNMLQAIKNGMFVTYGGEELPEPTEDWIGKILLFRNEVPLEELPEEEEPIVDPDQPIHEPEEVIEEEEIVDGNRGLRNTRTAPVPTNYYEEYIVVADEQHPVEKLAGINEETGEEEFKLIYPLKWECMGSVKIDLSGYTTTKEMTAAIREAAEGKVDKIPGKGLSSNDFTTKEKNKLAGLSNYDDTNLRTLIGTKAEKVDVKNIEFPQKGSGLEPMICGLVPNTIAECIFVDYLSFAIMELTATEKCEYCIKFDVATAIPTLSLPGDIIWAEALTLEANKHYVIVVTYECGALYGDWKSYPIIEQEEEEEE